MKMIVWPALFVGIILVVGAGFPTKFQRHHEYAPLDFPRDHGKHKSFQTEWWHVCGNLESQGGAEWAYQFTVFRHCPGLRLDKDLFRMLPIDGYVGQLIITNCHERDFRFFEAGGSPLLGFAGSANNRLHLWVGHWSLFEKHGTIRLSAHDEGFGTELTLTPKKRPVLHGDNGFCQKIPMPGHASVHYSLPSLETSGSFTWKGEVVHVQGRSWLDREWGTLMFTPEVKGWNWACLQLDGDCEIMLNVILLDDGTAAQTSYGAMVLPDGRARPLKRDDFRIEAIDWWKSERTGALYPIAWSVFISSEGASLVVEPVLKNHEQVTALGLTVGIDYWEGPVRVTGTMNGRTVRGKGHIELAGYAQSIGGAF